MTSKNSDKNTSRLDAVVEAAQRNRTQREQGYRALALKMYPWICGRCQREFTTANVQELTVHHRDHNHDNNPADGSNWELLCVYCHDNEHQRLIDQGSAGSATGSSKGPVSTHQPFADLRKLLDRE